MTSQLKTMNLTLNFIIDSSPISQNNTGLASTISPNLGPTMSTLIDYGLKDNSTTTNDSPKTSPIIIKVPSSSELLLSRRKL